ncbi:MAG: ATP-binding protein [Terriglobia bacterium]
MQDFEKLGVFYLGKPYELRRKKRLDGLLLYDSKDLVTHGVCVGMTGSGKTGLCLSLLEEAAIDNIPALIIDPKGDLGNLLLTFPRLQAEDLEPWVNPEDAQKKGLSTLEYARQQAEIWKNGLAEWGQTPDRIQRLKDAADYTLYTPGSNAGIPVSVLKSLDAPPQSILEDEELLRERITSTVTSFLGLLNIEADPLRSREHILISTVLQNSWKQGQSLDLSGLIQQIQSPPVNKVGVMALESFYPSKDRFELAMQFNNLLAAPGFEAWLEGEPLDVQSFLYTPSGKPRLSIFSIAHLNEGERMFFVSLLLNQVVTWMRSQSGTTSLRALLYMDEVFGYFPPVANPPSKAPLLTLFKQARAYGLGVLLATQNPVDLDYKGLANAGTWFIGRLQTERDKARLLDGLEGASASTGMRFNRAPMEETLAGLGSRIFLMNNVHEDTPEVFESRWALSYLRGPLTRAQIKILMDQKKQRAASSFARSAPPPSSGDRQAQTTAVAAGSAPLPPATAGPPLLPPEFTQYFIPLRTSQPPGSRLWYQAMAFGVAKVYFTDTKANVDTEQTLAFLAPIQDQAVAVDWSQAHVVDMTEADLEKGPASEGQFMPLPAVVTKGKNLDPWKHSLGDALYRTQKMELFRSAQLNEISKSGETERDFRVRLQQLAREARDNRAQELRQQYAPRLASLQERIRRAQQAVDRESQQAQAQKLQTAISIGSTLLGALLGRKAISASTLGRATTAARGVSRSMKESQDVARAGETVEALNQQLSDLESQLQQEISAMETKEDPMTEVLETVAIKPKKSNISVSLVALAWAPCWQQGDGQLISAWE